MWSTSADLATWMRLTRDGRLLQLFPPRCLGDWRLGRVEDEQTWLVRCVADGWHVEHGPADLFIHGQGVRRCAFKATLETNAGRARAAAGVTLVTAMRSMFYTDGYLINVYDLYHRTSAEAAAAILRTGRQLGLGTSASRHAPFYDLHHEVPARNTSDRQARRYRRWLPPGVRELPR